MSTLTILPQYSSRNSSHSNKIEKGKKKKKVTDTGTVVTACNPSTWEAEARGLWVRDKPGLKSKTLSLKSQKLEREKNKTMHIHR
jgi:hypothetical protein